MSGRKSSVRLYGVGKERMKVGVRDGGLCETARESSLFGFLTCHQLLLLDSDCLVYISAH